MKLKFKAKGICPLEYTITGETINGFDLSQFPEGGQFVGNEQTQDAGVYHAERVNGELTVTLAQRGIGYEVPVYSSDWRGTDTLIDANDYSPDTCYIDAISKSEGAVYVRRENGWTVTEVSDE